MKLVVLLVSVWLFAVPSEVLAGWQFSERIAVTGVAIRTPGMMISGSYFLKNDKLCVIFNDELSDCGYIYPGSNSNEFTRVTLGDVYKFSNGY
jgi:hypothetical protein